jgi:hypothetical protein
VSAATSLVLATLGAGLALTAAGWLTCGAIRAALTTAIGDTSWDFSKSWASNITVVGAILGTVLSAKILPTTPTVVVSPNGYTALSLLFGLLVVVAPLLFTALRSGTPDPKGPKYQGYGWGFLLSSCVTLWAVIGELATVGLVLYEAQHGNTLARGAVIPMWAALGSAIVLISIYGLKTVQVTVKPASDTSKLESINGTPTIASRGWTLL